MKPIIDSLNNMLTISTLTISESNQFDHMAYRAKEVYNEKQRNPQLSLEQWATALKLPTSFKEKKIISYEKIDKFINYSTNEVIENRIVNSEQIPQPAKGNILKKIAKSKRLTHDFIGYIGGQLINQTPEQRDTRFYTFFSEEDQLVLREVMNKFIQLPSKNNPKLAERQGKLLNILNEDDEFRGILTVEDSPHLEGKLQKKAIEIYEDLFKLNSTLSESGKLFLDMIEYDFNEEVSNINKTPSNFLIKLKEKMESLLNNPIFQEKPHLRPSDEDCKKFEDIIQKIDSTLNPRRLQKQAIISNLKARINQLRGIDKTHTANLSGSDNPDENNENYSL